MTLLQLIFKLVKRFVPLGMDEYNSLWADAQKWEESTNDDESTPKLKQLYFQYNREWWFRLICAIAFIPLTREIILYQNPQIKVHGQGDDDTDEFE